MQQTLGSVPSSAEKERKTKKIRHDFGASADRASVLTYNHRAVDVRDFFFFCIFCVGLPIVSSGCALL